MSFAARAATKPASKTPSCAVREVLAALPADEAAAASTLLAEPIKDRPHTLLARDFAEEGYPLSDSTIGKHRRLECSCRFLVEQ